MRWETFTLLFSKFIHDATYQILSESSGLCRRYDKNILAYFFWTWCIAVGILRLKLLLYSVSCRIVVQDNCCAFAGVFLQSDENECEDELACGEDEYCMNTDGSYKCIGK